MENTKLIPLASLCAKRGGPIDCSLSHLYKAARTGEIPVVPIGRKILVPTWWVEKVTGNNS